MSEKKPWPGWQEIRVTVPVEPVLAEYERLKKMLPPGVEPAIDMAGRPWEEPLPVEPAPPPARQGPGRPGWTEAVFDQHMADAEAATGEPRTMKRVAANFRRLDGAMGVEEDHFRTLRRKRKRGEFR